jgi:hypothetical protein
MGSPVSRRRSLSHPWAGYRTAREFTFAGYCDYTWRTGFSEPPDETFLSNPLPWLLPASCFPLLEPWHSRNA